MTYKVRHEWRGPGDSWFRLSTAGPSVFINFWSNNSIQMLGTKEAESLRAWLGEMIKQMKDWEEQES